MSDPFFLEVPEELPRRRRRTSEAHRAARGAVGLRPPKVTEHEAKPKRLREPWDREVAMARCRADGEADRRKYYTCMGVDPDAPDRDALRDAELERRQAMVAAGYTYVRGVEETIEAWRAATGRS